GRAGRDTARLDGETQGRPAHARGGRQVPAVLGRHGLHLGEPHLPALPRRPPRLDRWRRRRGDAHHPVQGHGHAAEALSGSATMTDTTTSASDVLQTGRREGFWFARLNRPEKRNALSDEL